MQKYLIDCSEWFDEGGYCQVYPIKNHKNLVFKEFRNKKRANEAHSVQKKLAKFDLAPKIFSKVCKLKFAAEEGIFFDNNSDWGYVIEKASPVKHDDVTMENIQYLVEDIKEKTGLKFWDCHWYNVGLVKRNKKNKVVCIDTGKESFTGDANAWGFSSPGPRCCYCSKYQCKCSS